MLELSIAIAIVTGIVEAIKRAFAVNSRYAPLISLVLGLGIAFLFSAGLALGEVIVSGLVIGLSASGLYSGGKAVLKK